MAVKKPARPFCVCGGSWAQHQATDDGCWCKKCLYGPPQIRCRVYSPPQTTEPGTVDGQEVVQDSLLDSVPPVGRNVAPIGKNHPATAKNAAAGALLRSGTFRRELVDIIRKHVTDGCTDDELEHITGRSHQSVSATRNSLVADGWLRDSGQRRPTRYGNDAIAWVLARNPERT